MAQHLSERREKQREVNPKRAAKMREAGLKFEPYVESNATRPKHRVYVGCSGWYYWEWRDSFYLDVPRTDWFNHYADVFDTVELNASFYSWPTIPTVESWRRQLGERSFVYTVKVSELITHVHQFKDTEALVRSFDVIANILGNRLGCLLYQTPPGFHFTKERLADIINQLLPIRRNVVEFRHASWWNEDVYEAFRNAGIIFCSCSAPRLPDELIRTADDVYIRLHGTQKWYTHDYSAHELETWALKIQASGAKTAWIYFNNTIGGNATSNALRLRSMLSARPGE